MSPSPPEPTTPAPRAAGLAIRAMGSVAERQAALLHRFPRWQPRTLGQHFDAAVSEFPERPYVITTERSWPLHGAHAQYDRAAVVDRRR